VLYNAGYVTEGVLHGKETNEVFLQVLALRKDGQRP